MTRAKPLDEAAMLAAEVNIPTLAAKAGRDAHFRALNFVGRVVMKSEDGWLVERLANGEDVVIRRLPDSTPTSTGAVLKRIRTPAAKR